MRPQRPAPLEQLAPQRKPAFWLAPTASEQPLLKRKPIPAVLHKKVVAALAPTDPLRLGRVQDEPVVRTALEEVLAAHDRVCATRVMAATSPEAAERHALAVREHQSAIRGQLEPAVLAAEKRRALVVREKPPDCGALAAKVVKRVDAERVLAVDALLKRNPHWRDPSLWELPETKKYLARTVASEAAFLSVRRRKVEADLPRGAKDCWRSEDGREVQGKMRVTGRARGDRRRSPVEIEVQGREGSARRAALLRHLVADAPEPLQRAIRLVLDEGVAFAEALRRTEVRRSVFENWLDRCRRGSIAGLTKAASNRGGRGGV